MKAERLWHVLCGLKEPLVMTIIQFAVAAYNILYRLAVNRGMNLKIFLVYRFIFATAFLAPLAIFYERKIWPRLTPKVLIHAFLCGIFGASLGQTLYLESLTLTSATYVSAMFNIVPGVTFVLAALFGLEKLSMRVECKAKVVGTLLGIGGAMLLTFYKGIEIKLYSTRMNLSSVHHTVVAGQTSVQQHHNFLLGSILAVCCCLSLSISFIIQAKISKEYPCLLSSTALIAFMAMVQSLIYALVRENDWNQWRLHWNLGLLAIVYAGIVISGLCFTLMTWCIRRRGPLFTSVFSPLTLVILALTAPLLLSEKLYLGSVIGGGLIICGLYSVLWGQGKERKRLNQLVLEDSVGPALEISATTETKEVHNNDDGGRSKMNREEAEPKYSELEEGMKSSATKSQAKGLIVPSVHNT